MVDTVLFWLLIVATFAISLSALGLATRKFANARLNRRVLALEAASADLESTLEKVLRDQKKLVARLSQRQRRANGQDDSKTATGETPEQWKARMRRELALKRQGG